MDLVKKRYLQDLQKQAEKNQRPSSTYNLDSLAQAAGYFRSPVSQPSGPVAQHPGPVVQHQGPIAQHPGPELTSQSYNVSRSCEIRDILSQEDAPSWRGLSDNAVIGINSIVNSESDGRAAFISPASTVHATQQTEIDPNPVTTPQYPNASTPFDVWPDVYPMPVKIIRNSQKNRRTWSKSSLPVYPLNSSLPTNLTRLDGSMASSMVDVVLHDASNTPTKGKITP